jgi:hypothetical protein
MVKNTPPGDRSDVRQADSATAPHTRVLHHLLDDCFPEGCPDNELIAMGKALADLCKIPPEAGWVLVWTQAPFSKDGTVLRIRILDPQQRTLDRTRINVERPRRQPVLPGLIAVWFGTIIQARPTGAPDWPYLSLTPPATPDLVPLLIQLREAQAREDGTEVYARLRWRPRSGTHISTHGFSDHPSKDVDKREWASARHALAFLRDRKWSGGRASLKDESDPALIELFKKIVAFKHDHPTYTLAQAAARYGVPYSTFKRWRNAWGHLIEESDPK